jgi:hypothetical protein
MVSINSTSNTERDRTITTTIAHLDGLTQQNFGTCIVTLRAPHQSTRDPWMLQTECSRQVKAV